MSGPTSSVPVVSTVTCTKIGVSVAGRGARDLGAVDRGLDLQRVLAGLDQDRIDAAGDQPAALLGQRRLQRIVGDVAERRQLGARPDAADHPAVPSVGEMPRPPRAPVRRRCLLISNARSARSNSRQRDRRAAEGVGLHHVGAGLEIAAMDFAHQVGARQAQHVGAVLAAPVIALDVQRQRLHAAAHAAVAQQHGVAQRVEQMGTGHRDLPSDRRVRRHGCAIGCFGVRVAATRRERQAARGWRSVAAGCQAGIRQQPAHRVVGEAGPAMRQPGGQLVAVVRARGRSPSGRPPGRSTRAASASTPAGPRRSAAPSAARRYRTRRRPAAAGTCRPAAPRSGRQPGAGQARAGQRQHRLGCIDAEALADARGQQFQHPSGAGADVQQPACTALRHQASSAASTACAGRSSARISSQSAPWRRKLSEAMRARSASTRAAWRRSASRIGSSSGRRASRSRTSAPVVAGGQREPDIGALRARRSSSPASHSSFRWRDRRGCDWPRISVNSMTQNGAAAASASRRRRVGSAAARRASEQVIHGLANDINISLCLVDGERCGCGRDRFGSGAGRSPGRRRRC